MNRRVIALIVVVLALVGGGIIFVSSQSTSTVAQATATPVATASPTTTPTASPRFTPIPTPVPSPTDPANARVTISGKVTRMSTGDGIGQIQVAFYRNEPTLCASFGTVGATIPLAAGIDTKSDGTYLMKVPIGTFKLRVASRATGEYWWNGKNTCDSADLVMVNSDTIMNFTLP